MSRRHKYLFADRDLGEHLRHCEVNALQSVEGIDPDRFGASSDDEIVQRLVSEYSIEPLCLFEDQAQLENEETQIDVSGERARVLAGPFYVEATKITVAIPYTGSDLLWKLKPKRFSSSFPFADISPSADVNPGELKITISKPRDTDPEEFKADYEDNLKLLRSYISWSTPQVERFNGQLADLIGNAIAGRRARLEAQGDLSSALNIPLRQPAGATVADPKPMPDNQESGRVVHVSVNDLSEDEAAIHRRHMGQAIELAKSGPFPFASLIVDRRTQEIVTQAVNETDANPVLHSEIVAIMNCAKANPGIEWENLTIYTPGEPCPMCQAAIVWTRIGETVYGTSIRTFQAMGVNQIAIPSQDVAAAASFYRGRIIGGVLSDETDQMYREWAASLPG